MLFRSLFFNLAFLYMYILVICNKMSKSLFYAGVIVQ